MRIPKIYRRDGEEAHPKKITYVDLNENQLSPIEYDPDVDFNDDKSVSRYIKTIKSQVRQSSEYKSLMYFLKTKCEMNRCLFLPHVKKYRDSAITIEIHHTGLVLEDIVKAVLKKRYANNESYDVNSIAEEIMYDHYRGIIGLTALSATMHDLIHEPESALFIPLQMVDFGNMEEFVTEYFDYIDKETLKKFDQYKLLSNVVVNIKDIIPDYLDVDMIYFKKDGVEIPDMDKILDIMKDVI